MDYIDDVFGPTGYLAQYFSGYEPRLGQVALARAVENAFSLSRHLLAEAPCGTGKSVAYGVPASWHASRGHRVVIVTANIALQEQLVRKDLPMLKEVLPWKFTYALLKGRGNYWCREAASVAHQKYFQDLKQSDPVEEDAKLAKSQVDKLIAWGASTETGDKSDLSFVPVSSLWSRVSVGEGECGRQDCEYFDNCFYYEAKAKAHVASIIVTNYHLFFMHLYVRCESGKNAVLPAFDRLILDEAHEAADIARDSDAFGFKVSERTVRNVASRIRRRAESKIHTARGPVIAAEQKLESALVEPVDESAVTTAQEVLKQARIGLQLIEGECRLPLLLASNIDKEAIHFFSQLVTYAQPPTYSVRFRQPNFVEEPTRLVSLLEAADRSDLARRIIEVVRLEDENTVYFLDKESRTPRVIAKPIDVSVLLHDLMFATVQSVVLTSATLTAGGSFTFVRRELGVPEDALEIVVESPFDFRNQALLVVPTGLPSVESPGFPQAMTDAMREVIDACEGRTLCLFTSNGNLAIAHDKLRGQLPYTLLRQGELPRTELTRLFKEDVHSVLLGTNSFWTGIDVPGEALTGLVIDKLPFPNRSDPVVDIICERDPKWFDNYSKPRAAIMLRQGVGRLIRSQRDIGVVVILDRRLVDKYYKRDFFRSLPPMGRSPDLGDVARFLRGEELRRQAAPAPSASLLQMP